jgi:hypothetical protein
LVDLTISHRAQAHEIEHGLGEYWWLSVLRALTGAGKDEKAGAADAPIDMSKVQWL